MSLQHLRSYRAIHIERKPYIVITIKMKYVLQNSRADSRHESSPVHAWWAVDVGHRGRFSFKMQRPVYLVIYLVSQVSQLTHNNFKIGGSLIMLQYAYFEGVFR